MTSVDFTKDNMMSCLCGGCPVQAESACVAEKSAALTSELDASSATMPAAAAVPGLYCATGVAACDDLDFTQTCSCPQCPVYAANALTQWKYCERGDASSLG